MQIVTWEKQKSTGYVDRWFNLFSVPVPGNSTGYLLEHSGQPWVKLPVLLNSNCYLLQHSDQPWVKLPVLLNCKCAFWFTTLNNMAQNKINDTVLSQTLSVKIFKIYHPLLNFTYHCWICWQIKIYFSLYAVLLFNLILLICSHLQHQEKIICW